MAYKAAAIIAASAAEAHELEGLVEPERLIMRRMVSILSNFGILAIGRNSESARYQPKRARDYVHRTY